MNRVHILSLICISILSTSKEVENINTTSVLVKITYLYMANLIHFQSHNLIGCGKLNRNVNVRVYDIVVCIYTFQDIFCRSNVWIGILIDICITSYINRRYTHDVIHSKYSRFKNQCSSLIKNQFNQYMPSYLSWHILM